MANSDGMEMPLLARIIHDNWMFDYKLFGGMSLWQTHLKQSAHAGVPALASRVGVLAA